MSDYKKEAHSTSSGQASRKQKANSRAMSSNDTKLQQQVESLTADLQRAQADFMNYKRRTSEEQAQLMQIAKEQVILQILPVLDNIHRALNHLPKDLADNAWANGVKKVGEQTIITLRNLGIEPIKAVGQEFNPELHEAINFEDGNGEHEVVTEELQTGYKMGERVIRPAMVRVARVESRKHQVENNEEKSDG